VIIAGRKERKEGELDVFWSGNYDKTDYETLEFKMVLMIIESSNLPIA
jgi:hypothetical protein